MRRLITILILICSVILAACGSDAPPPPTAFSMPTLAFLPSETGEATATITVTSAPSPVGEITEVAIATAAGTATATSTPQDTLLPTLSVTPSETITDTPTSTPSVTPTITPTVRQISGLEGLALLAQQATILPSDFAIDGTPIRDSGADAPVLGTPSSLPSVFDFFAGIPGAEDFFAGGAPQVPSPVPAGFSSVANCESSAPGGFGTLEANNPSVRTVIGCPLGSPPNANTVMSAYQEFQGGFMLWVENPGGQGTIYVVNSNGSYQTYPDTWSAGVDPESGGETPPSSDLTEPIRGFGSVWRDNASVRNALGWATGGESGSNATFTEYERGVLLYAPQRGNILSFAGDGSWRSYDGGF